MVTIVSVIAMNCANLTDFSIGEHSLNEFEEPIPVIIKLPE